MTDIASRILGAMNEFGVRGDRRVRSIYLGADEWNAIEADMRKGATYAYKAGEVVPNRRTFNGAAIFRVDAPSHLGVGT